MVDGMLQKGSYCVSACRNGNGRHRCRGVKPDHAVLDRALPGGWVPMSGMKVQSPVVLSTHAAFHRWSAQSAARLLSSDGMMSCYAGVQDWCLDLRCRELPAGGQVSVEWSRCPGSAARRVRDSVAALPLSSALLDTREERKIVRWCGTQASIHSSQGVTDDKVSEAGVSTTAPGKCAVLCRWMGQERMNTLFWWKLPIFLKKAVSNICC